ncbi:MAG TPA: ATP-dependent DNA helicase [Acidimicrobiia bacterium]|nr:ATP-dependent DNA helicase [Acidimicrobiia bacterium]
MFATADTRVLAEPEQWSDAIADSEGPQLIVAGPGTGKTHFLARRVAHLLGQGVPAGEILVLTFSRRAASELEGRIGRLLPRPVSNATASTFHSYAHRLVERHRHTAGLPMPILLTGPEQVRFVARLLAADDPGRWPVSFRPLLDSPTLAAEVGDFMMRCHERLLEPAHLARMAEKRSDWRALPGFLASYRTALEAQGKIDYGRLVAEAVEVAESSPELTRYRYVVVDEYQDTSPAQARLCELAAGEDVNLTVAADPHQSIYSFRGAELENVEQFPDRIGAFGRRLKATVLARSFRVPAPILDSARRLVAPNPAGGLPSAEVVPATHDGAVEVYTFDQRSAEAEWIAAEVERLVVSEALALESIAVLVRSTRHLLPELSRALERRRIPHDRPDARLIDHPAVRLLADVVQAAVAPPGSSDMELAVRRLLLGPAIGLSIGREREILRTGRRRSMTWPELIRQEIPGAEELADLISDATWATTPPAVEGFWHLWDRLPGITALVADPERADYRTAWSTFSRILERQAERDPSVTLVEFLEATATGEFEANPLLSFSTSGEGRLVVTTLHQAKGLEFDVVFIADAVEGVFPDNRRSRSLIQPHLLAESMTTDGAALARFRLEEERRLAYTATTRARRRVVWTATTAGIDEGERRPSRFILAAAGADSFDSIAPPPEDSKAGFAPLTLSAAEASLRRLVLDPTTPTVARLAALATLAGSPHWEPLWFAGMPRPGPDSGVMPETFRLSPSQAGAYEECPRRYVLERRLRAVEADSPYLVFGSLIHEVLENTEEDAAARGAAHGDLQSALSQLEAVWDSYPPFGPPPVDEAWKRRARTLLEELYSDWPGGDDPAVALELELRAPIGGVEWVGRADRVDRTAGGIKVVDYKTSKNPPTLKEVAGSLQLGFYLLAAAEHPELTAHGPPVAAELWFPLARAKRKVYPFDMAKLDEVRQTLEAVTHGIRSENWETRIGSHCGRCAFRDVCPAWPDGRDSYR